jgi:hypothetical protein
MNVQFLISAYQKKAGLKISAKKKLEKSVKLFTANPQYNAT